MRFLKRLPPLIRIVRALRVYWPPRRACAARLVLAQVESRMFSKPLFVPSRLAPVVFCIAVMHTAVLSAALTIHDPRFVAEQRLASGPQAFPITVGSDSSIYGVTGTSTSDALVRINTDNSVTTLNSSVGRVVGVIADLEVGFGGDLFANFGLNDTHGVVRFDNATGTASTFYSAASFNADGGLAFDAAHSLLYLQSQLPNAPLIALDSSGNATTVVASLGEGRGLALESTGTIITIGSTDIRRVDPTTHAVSSILDISSTLPGFLLRSVDVLSTGEIVFSAENGSAATRELYSIGPNGGPLNLIATDTSWGPLGIKDGVSRDGLGESLYFSNPNTFEVYELRFTAVPCKRQSSRSRRCATIKAQSSATC